MDSNLLKTKSIEQLVGDVEHGAKALKRTLSALDLTLLGIGAIIGTGIFVLTGTAAANQAGPGIALSYMLRVALTGGIATGKSYCLGQFGKLGAAIIDADLLARDAVARGTPGLRAVVARFGQEMLSEDGSLNRAALAGVVFADNRARGDLEAIIHPEVYQRIREWLANLGSGVRTAIADIPLLFESGHHHDYDRIVVAACEPPEQVRRMPRVPRSPKPPGTSTPSAPSSRRSPPGCSSASASTQRMLTRSRCLNPP